MTSTSEPGFRRPKGAIIVLPFLFGIMAFARAMDSPRFELLTKLDVLWLTAAGANIGVGMVTIGMWVRSRKS